jgi:tetratricopeptide (TPR) repeat protein
MFRTRRTLMVAGLLLAGASVTAFFCWKTWRRRDLQRRIDLAVTALHDDGSLDVVRDALGLLAGRPEWRSTERFLQGGILLRSENPGAALREFQFVRNDGNLRIPLHLLTGRALLQTGQLIEAARVLQVVVSEQPDDPEGHRWLAMVCHEFGSGTAALAELQHVVRLRPDHFLGYRLVGLIYADDYQMYELAARHYREALDRQPPEPHLTEIRRELVRCLLLMKRYAEVLDVLEDLPESFFKQVVAVEAHWGLGESAEAIRLLDRLEETNPDEEGVLMLGAVLAIDQGDARSAVPRLQKVLERNPQNYVARYHLSLAYQNLGDTNASKAESERMLEIRKLQKRLEELHKQAFRQPADADVREELAAVCEQLGQTADAVRWRRNAAQTRLVLLANGGPPSRQRTPP